MDAFSYLSVLLSIILGLAITQALQGVRALILARERIRFFLPPVAYTVFITLVAVQLWWASFGLRNVDDWNFASFTLVLAQCICVYLLAALILPDIGEAQTDLRAHYFKNFDWFAGVLLATLVISIAKDVVLSGNLPDTQNLIFHGVFAAAIAVGLVLRAPIIHIVLSLSTLATFGVYIALLFARL